MRRQRHTKHEVPTVVFVSLRNVLIEGIEEHQRALLSLPLPLAIVGFFHIVNGFEIFFRRGQFLGPSRFGQGFLPLDDHGAELIGPFARFRISFRLGSFFVTSNGFLADIRG